METQKLQQSENSLARLNGAVEELLTAVRQQKQNFL